jgi:DNA polymerase-3 subunit epsilon
LPHEYIRFSQKRKMIRDFIAIDFETANQQPSSVCSIGVVMVRNGQIVDSFYSLIQPEPNYYNYWCQRVHGLSQCDTDDAPVFSKVWQQLEEKIADVFLRPDDIKRPEVERFSDQQTIDNLRYQIASIPFVAHNARFDEGCLKAVFKVYQMDYPDYRFYDTLAAARRLFGHSLPNHQLHTVAAACGYNLQNHHHALADAEACAAIALYTL